MRCGGVGGGGRLPCAMRWNPLAAAVYASINISIAACACPAQVAPSSPFAATLPKISGTAILPQLRASAKLERDGKGVATIRAGDAHDALMLLGYAHAQDRYFQMDLSRRYAAGELAELTGPTSLDMDRENRPLGLRGVARQGLDLLEPASRELLEAYVAGVNAGLASLPAPPPEYGLLGATPAPWRSEDSQLVLLAFAAQLQGGASGWQEERSMGLMKEVLAPGVYDYVTSSLHPQDCPLFGEHNGPGAEALPLPGPDLIDTRKQVFGPGRLPVLGAGLARGVHDKDERWALGSNNFAVDGTRTKDGRAIVCGDPHLGLSVPNVWYRADLHMGEGITLSGVTAPGLPGIIIGAALGKFAWTMTNAHCDFMDLVVLTPPVGGNAREYQTPQGAKAFVERTEHIKVRGGAGVEVVVRSTVWGPVVGKDHRGRELALMWTAFDPRAYGFGLLSMLNTAQRLTTLDSVLTYLAGNIGPAQNVVVASNDGQIGYILSGAFPNRRGFNGSVPADWATGQAGWDGYMPEEQRPRLIGPSDGVLATANNRVWDLATTGRLGFSGASPFRAKRAKELLGAKRDWTEAQLRLVALDTRAESFDLIRDIIMKLKGQEQAQVLAGAWNGRADADQVGYRLVRRFGQRLTDGVSGVLLAKAAAAAGEAGQTLRYSVGDGPVRGVLMAQPAHLVPDGSGSWESYFASELSLAMKDLAASKAGSNGTWGEVNMSAITHPIGAALPGPLGKAFNMPATPQSGDVVTLRVARPTFGASLRMVLSPGHEADGYFHMPGGQSGNPASPHYRDMHSGWANGKAAAWSPEAATATLEFTPR